MEAKFYKKYKDAVLKWFDGLCGDEQHEVIAEVTGNEYNPKDFDVPYDPAEYESDYEYLDNFEADEWFWKHFGGYGRIHNGATSSFDSNAAVVKILKESCNNSERSYVDDFVQDIAYHMEGYGDAKGFFEDLAYGGCVSGMIGMFIYNSDCKKFYIDHIDDMENFKSELEEELGEPIKNTRELPHYTFMCWLCYEEFARYLSDTLFNN